MGHNLEYFVDLPPASARAWLSSVGDRWIAPESPDEMLYAEFAWAGEALHVYLGPSACYVCVATIKYSWLLDPSPAVEWVGRFERWLCETLPGVRAVRLDELLRLWWEREAGRYWNEIPDPVGALWDWLLELEDDSGYEYFRLLLGVKAEWLTADVVGLAKAIHSRGRQDPENTAILADALEEAGCDVTAVLNYCREIPATVARPGWWVADAILRASTKSVGPGSTT